MHDLDAVRDSLLVVALARAERAAAELERLRWLDEEARVGFIEASAWRDHIAEELVRRIVADVARASE